MGKCNITKYEKGMGNNFVECGKPAIWRNPRWPDGVWCDKCKEDVSIFFPDDWNRIKED